jgi:hypothetical protein
LKAILKTSCHGASLNAGYSFPSAKKSPTLKGTQG